MQRCRLRLTALTLQSTREHTVLTHKIKTDSKNSQRLTPRTKTLISNHFQKRFVCAFTYLFLQFATNHLRLILRSKQVALVKHCEMRRCKFDRGNISWQFYIWTGAITNDVTWTQMISVDIFRRFFIVLYILIAQRFRWSARSALSSSWKRFSVTLSFHTNYCFWGFFFHLSIPMHVGCIFGTGYRLQRCCKSNKPLIHSERALNRDAHKGSSPQTPWCYTEERYKLWPQQTSADPLWFRAVCFLRTSPFHKTLPLHSLAWRSKKVSDTPLATPMKLWRNSKAVLTLMYLKVYDK